MKLVVLGASGACGQWLVRLAAAEGHSVTALVRHTTPFDAPAGVTVHRGEALDPGTIDRVVAGHDAVLSCLGLRRAGPSPWARLLSPPDLTARVTRLVISAMRRHQISRIVALSAGGVGESLAQLSGPVRWLVNQGQVRVAYRDLAEMERELAESGLESLAIRPVTLMNGQPRGRAVPVARYGLTSTVRRADVAAWMLDAARRPVPFASRSVLLGSSGARAARSASGPHAPRHDLPLE